MHTNWVKAARLFGALSVSASLALTGCAAPETIQVDEPSGQKFSPETATHIEDVVREALTLSGSSEAVVGVWADWSGSWEGAVTAGAGNAALSPNATFRAGQLSDVYACAILGGLVADGVVAYDDKVTTVLKHQPRIEDITFRQLCEHSSGLANYDRYLHPLFVANPTRHWPEIELIANALARSPIAPPGTEVSFSPTETVLLGRALRAAASTTWDALANKYLIDRLGLPNTSYPDPEDLTMPSGSLRGQVVNPTEGGFDCAAPQVLTKTSPSIYGQAGALITSPRDVRTVLTAYTNGQLVGEKITAEVLTPVPLFRPRLNADGIEVPISEEQEAANASGAAGLGLLKYGDLWGSYSAAPGYASAALHDPNTGLTIVVSLNNSTASAEFPLRLAQRLAAVVAAAAPEGAPALTWDEAGMADQLGQLAVCPLPAPAE